MTRSLAIAALISGCLLGHEALGQLKFYYDPATGTVAFDTAGTRTGGIYGYGFEINPRITDLRFRPGELVRLWNTTFVEEFTDYISEISLSQSLSGYFTIGEILPEGLPEDVWTETFKSSSSSYSDRSTPGYHYYTDAIGIGKPPSATLIYGLPDRPFDNRWDIVDPDTLDWATSATLVYDPATGNVRIDTARGEGGGHITFFTMQSEGAFLAENFTPWGDFPLTTATAGVIGLAADAIEPGVYSIGNILPTGLTLDELRSTFTNAQFISRAGFGGASFNLEADGLDFGFALATAVPEPATLVIGAVALAALPLRRNGV